MGYTDEERREAERFLMERIRNEQSMEADVLRLLEQWAGYLLAALFRNASEDEIEEMLQDLIDLLLGDCETLAVDEHDRKELILLWMNGERGGETLASRVHTRVHTFYQEVLAVFLAGRLLGMGQRKLLNSIRLNLTQPWENEVIVEARQRQEKGTLTREIDLSAPHYGKGVAVASLTALDRMLRYAVADAWMYWGYLDAAARGAKGYYVLRGSSYPCEECDSHTGVFFPIGDEEDRPQYHLNCCCYVVYTYVERV